MKAFFLYFHHVTLSTHTIILNALALLCLAEIMKTKGNLAGEITNINANKDERRDLNSAATPDVLAPKSGEVEKNLDWEKPAWTQDAGLKSTAKGEKLKTKGDLAKPITFPSKYCVFGSLW